MNKAGPGVPSDSTHPIVAKPRNLAPKIDRTNLIDIKIKVGQKFGFDVKVCLTFARYVAKIALPFSKQEKYLVHHTSLKSKGEITQTVV